MTGLKWQRGRIEWRILDKMVMTSLDSKLESIYTSAQAIWLLHGSYTSGRDDTPDRDDIIVPSRRDDETRRNAKGARTHLAASL